MLAILWINRVQAWPLSPWRPQGHWDKKSGGGTGEPVGAWLTEWAFWNCSQGNVVKDNVFYIPRGLLTLEMQGQPPPLKKKKSLSIGWTGEFCFSGIFSLTHSLYQQHKPGIPEAALISWIQFLRKTSIDWDGSFMSITMAGYEGGKGGICDVWSVLMHSEARVSL